MKTKFPATVMIFGVVSSEGHIMPPHIVEADLKVNTKVYLDVLKCVVIPYEIRRPVADSGCGTHLFIGSGKKEKKTDIMTNSIFPFIFLL